MRDITTQAKNVVTICGKVMNCTVRKSSKDGKNYAGAKMEIRVKQVVEGKEEVENVTVDFFAGQYKMSGGVDTRYEEIMKMETIKTAANVGIDDADCVRLEGVKFGPSLKEKCYVGRSGALVKGFEIAASYFNLGKRDEMAIFNTELYILNMKEEFDRDGNPTGRLVISGAIVGYEGRKVDVMDFIVEDPDKVDYFSRNFNINDTIFVRGRIRSTTKELQVQSASGSWGETFEETRTIKTRELIITGGNDEPYEEDMAYDPADMRKLMNIHKAQVEQIQSKSSGATAPSKKAGAAKYGWE